MPGENEQVDGEDFAEFEKKANAKPEEGKADEPAEEKSEGEEDAGEGDEGDEPEEKSEGEDDAGEDDPEEKPKEKRKSKPPSERIREEVGKRKAAERQVADLEARFADLEKRLPAEKSDDTKSDEQAAPDPSDTKKYPLGVLDDQYIEDKIEWVADQKLAKTISASLQRQEEADQQAAAETQLADLRAKADNVASRGSELFDDYEETVIAAGLRGDYALTQTTFEAVADAEHGAQILHDLAKDPKEAERVAKLPPIQQLRFVLDKDAEIAGKTPETRRKPKAGDPPSAIPKGSGGRGGISPATTNFEDFERLANAKPN